MNKFQKEYIYRINKVIDYVENHLDTSLSLEAIAGVACFSPYHFHRIFAAFTGETLYGFINRKRLAKAATLLIYNPDDSIGDIAAYCGFNSVSVFSRRFKQYFEVSPTDFRKVNLTNNTNLK